MLRKKKQEQDAMMRQQGIEQMIAQEYRPKTYADTPLMNMMGQEIAGPNMPQEAGGGLEALAPKLMGSPEGRRSLADLLAMQKSMGGETTTLAEGANLIRINPITNKVESVAQGAPKREPVPSAIAEYNFAKDQGYKGTFQEFELAKRAAGAPKVAVDLKDPTAVAKAQSDVLKDWSGVVDKTGAREVADRFNAAKSAVIEANSGNKAADGALIYAIGKIYDPSGAVQEGDKNTILGNRSIPNEVKAYAQKVFTGGSLLPEERKGLYSVAGAMVKQRQQQLQSDQANYKSLATQLGGTGDFIKDPYADVFSPKVENQTPSIADAARAELEKRRKGGF
jgi:hypothetical protein